MLFSAPVFLFAFLPLVLTLFFATGRSKLVLLLSSLIFYAWGEPRFVVLLLFVILFNYLAGNTIYRAASTNRRILVSAAIIVDLLILAFFKYEDFLAQNVDVILSRLDLPDLPELHISLPLGISFFTFQSLAYLIDVYCAHIKPAPSLYQYALFKSFFPQLIAGPIARYQQVAGDFEKDHSSEIYFAEGIRRFVVGLAKKVIIADSLAPVVDAIFQTPSGQLSMSMAWLGAISFALQIFFDFSGYSDMAIGLGLLFGIRLPENFRYPYAAKSIREFWRRWHITLSSWFRDYLYIPLGGNRRGNFRTFSNLVTVFALCGLWHGAAWNFVCWGLYHGAFMALERTAMARALTALPKVLQHSYALVVVVVGWVIFRSPDLHYAEAMMRAMSGANGWQNEIWPTALYLNGYIWLVLAVGTVFSMPLPPLFDGSKAVYSMIFTAVRELGILLLAVVSIASVASQTHHAFIYFRF
jgi:alginate O-acetyltransferase complex protein AlgI